MSKRNSSGLIVPKALPNRSHPHPWLSRDKDLRVDMEGGAGEVERESTEVAERVVLVGM